MKTKIKYLFLFSSIVLTGAMSTGCYYDSEEDLYPQSECVTTNLSYLSDIQPIVQSRCYGCHSAAANLGGITLESYEELKNYIDSGQLEGVINHESGYSPMPKDQPKLPSCEIDKIAAWIADGALNN